MKTDPRCPPAGDCVRGPLARCASPTAGSPAKPAFTVAPAPHALTALRSRLQLSPVGGVPLARRFA